MKKKIITIVALSLVAMVAITAIVMSLVKVNKNTSISSPVDVYVTSSVTKNHENGRGAFKLRSSKESDKSKINSLYQALEKGFEQSALVSLFKGELGQTTNAYFEHPAGSAVNTMDKNFSSTSSYTIYFYYQTPKTISVGDRSLDYQYLFFEVSNLDSRVLVTFAVNDSEHVDISTESTEEVSSYTEYEFSYKAYVNLKGVYDLVSTWDLLA